MAEPFATRREFEAFKEREFDTFRNDVNDELRWLRRYLIALLFAAVVGPVLSSVISIWIRSPAVPQ